MEGQGQYITLERWYEIYKQTEEGFNKKSSDSQEFAGCLEGIYMYMINRFDGDKEKYGEMFKEYLPKFYVLLLETYGHLLFLKMINIDASLVDKWNSQLFRIIGKKINELNLGNETTDYHLKLINKV